MPLKISGAVVNKNLREVVFERLNIASIEGFHKINDRQWGCLIEDMNGEQRYIRVGAIVAEVREDMTAAELMQSEVDKYNETQARNAEKAAARKEKAAKDKAKREAAAAKVKEG